MRTIINSAMQQLDIVSVNLLATYTLAMSAPTSSSKKQPDSRSNITFIPFDDISHFLYTYL